MPAIFFKHYFFNGQIVQSLIRLHYHVTYDLEPLFAKVPDLIQIPINVHEYIPNSYIVTVLTRIFGKL